MILPLYLAFINIILMPLKYKYIAPTKYLQFRSRSQKQDSGSNFVIFFSYLRLFLHNQFVVINNNIMPLQ